MSRCHCNQNTKRPKNNFSDTNFFDCELEGESDFNYDADCGDGDEYAGSKKSVWKVFVDGNSADFNVCEDEDTLFERVWWLSKPPKISRQTCVVPARRVQVIKERLSSIVNGSPTLSEAIRNRLMENQKRRKHVISDVDYVTINNSLDEKKRVSCQEKTPNIIPACARRLDELL